MEVRVPPGVWGLPGIKGLRVRRLHSAVSRQTTKIRNTVGWCPAGLHSEMAVFSKNVVVQQPKTKNSPENNLLFRAKAAHHSTA